MMMTRPRMFGVVAALAVGIGAVPLSGLVLPAVSRADDNCDFNFYMNTFTNQCQFCDGAIMYWNYGLNQCLPYDPTPYVDPILGPAGPIGVGPNPIVGPVGPVGVGGVGPVIGPVGPVGVGGLGPILGPVGPGGIGPR